MVGLPEHRRHQGGQRRRQANHQESGNTGRKRIGQFPEVTRLRGSRFAQASSARQLSKDKPNQMAIKSLLSWFSNDLAIDLGTANTLVYAKNKGIVVREPSIVAVNKINNNVEAVGKEAKEMLRGTPGDNVDTRPMKDGVAADLEGTDEMLRHVLRKADHRTVPLETR